MKTSAEHQKPDVTIAATYDITYDCLNCGWTGKQYFNLGKRAPQTIKCPKCNCNDARKRTTAWPTAPRRVEPVDPWRVELVNPWPPRFPFGPGPARPVNPWPRRYRVIS